MQQRTGLVDALLEHKIITVAVVIIIAVLLISQVSSCMSQQRIDENRNRLDSFVNAPVDTVQSQIDEKRASQIQNILSEALTDGDFTSDEMKTVFGGTVLVGDSLTQALTTYGYLDNDNVVSKIGISITGADELIDTAIGLHPSRIVISFGENDLIETDGDADRYIENIKPVVAKVEQNLPKAHIYLTSVLPVTAEAEASASVLGKYAEFNESLKKYCSTDPSLTYIDTASVVKAHTDLFEPDGIHLQSAFYPYYMAEIARVMFE